MMAAILNCAMLDSDTAILDSDTLLSSLRFTQKHSHSTLMLTQTNSIWLKLIHSHLTWWWQESWILPSWILPSYVFSFKLTHTCQDLVPTICTKKLHSFILTQLDDGSHLDFFHVGFRHCHLGYSHTLVIFFQIHSKTLAQDLLLTIWPKLIQSKLQTHSFSFKLMMISHLELCHVGFRHLEFVHLGFRHLCYLLSDLLKLANTGSHSTLHSELQTNSIWFNLKMASHLDFCHLEFWHCHLGFRYLVIFSQIYSKTLSLHSDADSN